MQLPNQLNCAKKMFRIVQLQKKERMNQSAKQRMYKKHKFVNIVPYLYCNAMVKVVQNSVMWGPTDAPDTVILETAGQYGCEL